MSAPDGFEHCPRCTAPGLEFERGRHACASCGWTFYRNAAAAVFVIAEHCGRILLVRRAREPASGTLDLPGGFIDPGESAEAGLERELFEELGLSCRALHYLASYPNVYRYAGVTYHTMDICFHATLEREPRREAMDERELQDFVLAPRERIRLGEIGLDSPRRALADFLAVPR